MPPHRRRLHSCAGPLDHTGGQNSPPPVVQNKFQQLEDLIQYKALDNSTPKGQRADFASKTKTNAGCDYNAFFSCILTGTRLPATSTSHDPFSTIHALISLNPDFLDEELDKGKR